MAGRVEGKVAFITGAARGQGRSHALRLAEEGADIIAVDIAESIPGMEKYYAGATEDDLAETVRQIEALDRRIVATKADVRDFDALKAAVDEGVAQLGHVDIVSANAGVFAFGEQSQLVEDAEWDMVNDINAKGVWHTAKAVIPHLIEQGTGGSIVITSSTAGLKGTPNVVAYTASKHAVVGIMRTLALELAPHRIRVNTVHPTGVATDMILNEATFKLFLPHVEHPSREEAAEVFATTNALPVPWVEPIDISNAVLYLASDEARYVTGTELKIDAGYTVK
ncbi:mycofactocin-coupled SDR family oxidoreductase [Herbiconiux sp. KACC 21604]|uniref:mycofactocin-coupled SDR family oxidoreductase n=1 Tax=unclassified Herbiconiux TaxID=2618217 RepID=UPI0014921E85|nr:mycofactocin-coupled SDR family oxidoreductase [Herbiconiux sp. SALV-R1]QJU53197.1 mycofactocin-coupled SDR family oxidoreductase [Herbiconiux sp. SALV-R1]WPO88145.1 mycofactocin-coupled SDR family oxidoreductase [Herbiconiux sp. KACC 21604]